MKKILISVALLVWIAIIPGSTYFSNFEVYLGTFGAAMGVVYLYLYKPNKKTDLIHQILIKEGVSSLPKDFSKENIEKAIQPFFESLDGKKLLHAYVECSIFNDCIKEVMKEMKKDLLK